MRPPFSVRWRNDSVTVTVTNLQKNSQTNLDCEFNELAQGSVLCVFFDAMTSGWVTGRTPGRPANKNLVPSIPIGCAMAKSGQNMDKIGSTLKKLLENVSWQFLVP